MRIAVIGVALLITVTSCEDNVTNVTVARDSTPAACQDTVTVIERVPCIWREHTGWVCLDAPLPDGPEHDQRGDAR